MNELGRIDNEPTMIHTHCEPGCAMNRKDPENQCGDGCVLLTIQPQHAMLNPRVKQEVLAELSEAIYTPNKLMVLIEQEWQAKPWWQRAWLKVWWNVRDWWDRCRRK